MIQTDHRLSKDIDVFIFDPQYLSYLSPELAGEDVWGCDAFDSSAHYVKLIFKEGEIDFIVAPSMTGLPDIRRDVEGHVIMLEHPVEIAIKKLRYRGAQLKIRDVFDIAVVDREFHDLLADKLTLIAAKKDAILARLGAMTLQHVSDELSELDIQPGRQAIADDCWRRVKELIEGLPAPRSQA